jgi:hypothetical protein
MTKKELGQFFSKSFDLIKNHVKHIQRDDILIDPFAGAKDLLLPFENKHEAYDIMPIEGFDDIIVNDSLLNPPDYTGKVIITNPPYLNINKTNNKEPFELYQTDDLYKASLMSLMTTGERGIIILPTTFWFNERARKIRELFLSNFVVQEVDVFNQTMFEDTTYAVCSFYFEKRATTTQSIKFQFYGKKEGSKTLNYGKSNGYSVINDIDLKTYATPVKIGRYTSDSTAPPTNIFLYAIDNTEPIRSVIQEPYCGINTDRAFLTFTLEGITLNTQEQESLVRLFNVTLNELRAEYYDGFLSNYRNHGRKRIGFDFAYRLFEHCLCLIK